MFENMTHTPFILASYVIALVLLSGLGITSWRRTRHLEAQADALKAKTPGRQRRNAS